MAIKFADKAKTKKAKPVTKAERLAKGKPASAPPKKAK